MKRTKKISRRSKSFQCPGCGHDKFFRHETVEQRSLVKIENDRLVVTVLQSASTMGQMEAVFICTNCRQWMPWTSLRRIMEMSKPVRS